MNNLKLTDYSGFETLDFFTDENFIKYVLHPEQEDVTYWKEVSDRHPDKVSLMEEAKEWIYTLNKQPAYKSAVNPEVSWNAVRNRIDRHEKLQRNYLIPLKRTAKWMSGIAALFILYFGLSEMVQQGKQVVQSGFGEMRSIALPDASIATLNGNSQLYYVRGWRSEKPREIWLTGEASFAVKHVALKNRFQEADSFKVHVNGMELTVLGTKFNIKDRRGQTEIALLEGSLRIEKKGASAFSRIMKPGEVYIYDGQKIQKDASKVAALSQSWTKKELNVEGYTLKDITEILEDTYGYKVTLLANDVSGKRLSGTVPSGSAEDILFVVEKIFNVKIIRDKNQLLITH